MAVETQPDHGVNDISMRSERSNSGKTIADVMFKSFVTDIKTHPALQEGLLGRSPVESLASLRTLFNRLKALEDKDTFSSLFRLMMNQLNAALGESSGEWSPLIALNTGHADVATCWGLTQVNLARKFAFSPSRGTNNPGLDFIQKRFKQPSESWSAFISLVECAYFVMSGGAAVPDSLICAHVFSRLGDVSSTTRTLCKDGQLGPLRKHLDEEEVRAAGPPARVHSVQVDSAQIALTPLMEVISQIDQTPVVKEAIAKVEATFGKFKQPQAETRICFICKTKGHIASQCKAGQPGPKA